MSTSSAKICNSVALSHCCNGVCGGSHAVSNDSLSCFEKTRHASQRSCRSRLTSDDWLSDKNAFRVALDFRMPRTFFSQLVGQAKLFGHPVHEAFRPLRIEKIDHDDPFSGGGVHGSRAMLHELGFGGGRLQSRRDDLPGDHVETRRQRRCAMPRVFKLLLGHTTGLNGLVGGVPFDGLQRGRLVHAHRMRAVDRCLGGSVQIGLVDVFDLALELLGVFLRRVEPHLLAMRL